MFVARYRSIVAGVLVGSLSVFLTYHLEFLFHTDPNAVVRALKAAGFAIVVPGIIAAMLIGNVHTFHLYISAAVNFVFWLGFAWLCGVFVSKLIELRRAIAQAAGGPDNGVPADGSLSVGRSDRSSSLGSE